MIQCNRCNLQYIGETKRRLKDRFKPTTAAEHFLSSPNHTGNDMQLIPIENIFSNRGSIRILRIISNNNLLFHLADHNNDLLFHLGDHNNDLLFHLSDHNNDLLFHLSDFLESSQ